MNYFFGSNSQLNFLDNFDFFGSSLWGTTDFSSTIEQGVELFGQEEPWLVVYETNEEEAHYAGGREEWYEITDSEWITAVSYREEALTNNSLTSVITASGLVYHIINVEQDIVEDFVQSESKGRFYHSRLSSKAGKYAGFELGGDILGAIERLIGL